MVSLNYKHEIWNPAGGTLTPAAVSFGIATAAKSGVPSAPILLSKLSAHVQILATARTNYWFIMGVAPDGLADTMVTDITGDDAGTKLQDFYDKYKDYIWVQQKGFLPRICCKSDGSEYNQVTFDIVTPNTPRELKITDEFFYLVYIGDATGADAGARTFNVWLESDYSSGSAVTFS